MELGAGGRQPGAGTHRAGAGIREGSLRVEQGGVAAAPRLQCSTVHSLDQVALQGLVPR